MIMLNNKLSTVLFVVMIAAAGANFAVAQQPGKATPEKKAPGQALMEKQRFDEYEPSKRRRNSRQVCMKDELDVGAYCAKKCQTGYQMDIKGNFATCRSLTPLPPGVFPGVRRKEVGFQPKLPPPAVRPPRTGPG
jgi:hypothetical protein